MKERLSMKTKRTLAKNASVNYRKLTKTDRGKVIASLCEVTGWSNKHVIKQINKALLYGSAHPNQANKKVKIA